MLSSRMLIWNVSSRNIKSAIEHFCCTKSIRGKSICLAGSQFDSLHVVFPVELNRNSIRWKRIEFELVFSPCTSTLYPRNIWAQLGHDSVSFSNFISRSSSLCRWVESFESFFHHSFIKSKPPALRRLEKNEKGLRRRVETVITIFSEQ